MPSRRTIVQQQPAAALPTEASHLSGGALDSLELNPSPPKVHIMEPPQKRPKPVDDGWNQKWNAFESRALGPLTRVGILEYQE
jgi:hypothetical protein